MTFRSSTRLRSIASGTFLQHRPAHESCTHICSCSGNSRREGQNWGSADVKHVQSHGLHALMRPPAEDNPRLSPEHDFCAHENHPNPTAKTRIHTKPCSLNRKRPSRGSYPTTHPLAAGNPPCRLPQSRNGSPCNSGSRTARTKTTGSTSITSS